MSQSNNPWLVYQDPPDRYPVTLFCFPYAGGNGHLFTEWQKHLPSCHLIGIELPGRGRRFAEPCLSRLDQVVEHCFEAIKRHLVKPFAFYGHSNGALLAYELAHTIHRRLGLVPEPIMIAAKRAPQLGPERALHQLPDEEFIEVLKTYQGTPQTLLDKQELMELYLPILRADFALSETYRYAPRPPLPTDALLIAGEDDAIAPPESVFAWQSLFSGQVRREQIPGNHFFLNRHPDQLSHLIHHHIRTTEHAYL